MPMDFETLHKQLRAEIAALKFDGKPAELYEPIQYFMNLGGKRLRPMLTLLSFYLWKDDVKEAMKPAQAVEVFHNFTLMHDDIMDAAPMRRGQTTVHKKWNDNTAILSGDVMFVNAYEMLLDVPDQYVKRVVQLFNKCAREVCEGQQLDMNFENRMVKVSEYIEMIRLKTAVLLGFSLELGALLAGASKEDQELMRLFGENIGIGFQLTDDLLDVYADADDFGKQVGGDIISNKKTYLLINAWQEANSQQRTELNKWLTCTDFNPDEKVKAVRGIYDDLQIKEKTQAAIKYYFDLGYSKMDRLTIEDERKKPLLGFTKWLHNRIS